MKFLKIVLITAVAYCVAQIALIILWLEGRVGEALMVTPLIILFVAFALFVLLALLGMLVDPQPELKPWAIRNMSSSTTYWSERFGWGAIEDADVYSKPDYDENFPMPVHGEWAFLGAHEMEVRRQWDVLTKENDDGR
jgi:hypothetical protein